MGRTLGRGMAGRAAALPVLGRMKTPARKVARAGVGRISSAIGDVHRHFEAETHLGELGLAPLHGDLLGDRGRDWGSGSGDCRPAVLARRMPAGQPRKPDQKCMEGQRFISNHATFVVVRSQHPDRPGGQKRRPAGQSVSVEARRRPAGGAGRRTWEDAQKNGRPCRSVAPRVPDRGGQARRSASPGAGGRPTPERGGRCRHGVRTRSLSISNVHASQRGAARNAGLRLSPAARRGRGRGWCPGNDATVSRPVFESGTPVQQQVWAGLLRTASAA